MFANVSACSFVCRFSFGCDIHSRIILRRSSCSGLIRIYSKYQMYVCIDFRNVTTLTMATIGMTDAGVCTIYDVFRRLGKIRIRSITSQSLKPLHRSLSCDTLDNRRDPPYPRKETGGIGITDASGSFQNCRSMRLGGCTRCRSDCRVLSCGDGSDDRTARWSFHCAASLQGDYLE